MKFLYGAIGAAVLLGGAVWVVSAETKLYESPEIVALGQTLYEENCASCHGANLEGQENWRSRKPDGRLPAPPHDASGHTWHHPTEQLFAITKYGSEALVGDGYKSDMAAFGDILSDAEIRAVLAYIKSTWPSEIIEMHDKMDAQGG